MAEKLYHRDGQWCIVCDSEQEADAILKDREAMEALRATKGILQYHENCEEHWFYIFGGNDYVEAEKDDPADAILAAAGKERGDE